MRWPGVLLALVLAVAAGCSDDGASRGAVCGTLQSVANRLAAVAAASERGPVDLDGRPWDQFQRALAAADDKGRDGEDAVLGRAIYRSREQAARADAVGRGDDADPDQFRVHLVESAASFSDAVDRCRRFDHDVRWPGFPGA